MHPVPKHNDPTPQPRPAAVAHLVASLIAGSPGLEAPTDQELALAARIGNDLRWLFGRNGEVRHA